MYGIPAGETFHFLENRRLEQLQIGVGQLILAFDKQMMIIVEGFVGVTPPGGVEAVYEDVRSATPPLLPLLGEEISAVKVLDRESFMIEFPDGSIVRFIDSSSDYQSFEVVDKPSASTGIVV